MCSVYLPLESLTMWFIDQQVISVLLCPIPKVIMGDTNLLIVDATGM